MISQLARDDYEDLLAAGLPATLDDFDRLNSIALRLTNGPETTAANFPRIGWAGDVPFFQPTCAALSWYLQFVKRAPFGSETKDFCWFYALAHGRDAESFDGLCTPDAIRRAVEGWMATLHVTADEISRACLYAVNGYDDAEPAMPDNAKQPTAEESLANLDERVTTASAATGIEPEKLMRETPSRLEKMVEVVKRLYGREDVAEKDARMRDYDLTLREIRARLKAEKEAENG